VSLRYVAFEGIEGAGKSTAARLMAQRLADHGQHVVSVREPGGTTAGERIRKILLEPDGTLTPWTEALLFTAARAELMAVVVAPALAAGAWVVSDRSAFSSLAYQGAGRRLGVDEVRAVNDAGLGGRWPELVFLLRFDPARGRDRQAVADRIGAESLVFQRTVSAAFDTLAAEDPQRFVVLDAGRPLDDILEEAWDTLLARTHLSPT